MYLLSSSLTDSEGGVKNVATMVLTDSARRMVTKMGPGKEQVLEIR